MGNFGSILLTIIICGCLYGGVCYYFKIFGQLSNSIIQIFITNINDYWYFSPNMLVVIIWIILSPLMFKKTIHEMNITNYIGVFCAYNLIISLFVLFVYKLKFENSINFSGIEIYSTKISWIEKIMALCGLIDTFLYQFNLFNIYVGLKNRSSKKMRKLCFLAVFSACILDIIAGILGYIMYVKRIDNIIIEIIREEFILYLRKKQYVISLFLFLLIISFLLGGLFSIPLLFFGAKENYLNIIFLILKKLFSKKINDEKGEELIDINNKENMKNKEKNKTEINENKYLIFFFTLIFYIIALIITLYAEKLINMLNAMGAIASNPLICIFPPISYILLNKNKFQIKLIIPWLIVCFGFSLIIIYFYYILNF